MIRWLLGWLNLPVPPLLWKRSVTDDVRPLVLWRTFRRGRSRGWKCRAVRD